MNELASKVNQPPLLSILKGSRTIGICLLWVMIVEIIKEENQLFYLFE